MCFRKTIYEGQSLNLCIAEWDIITYKLLKKRYPYVSMAWQTPYQYERVYFENGIAVQEQKVLEGWIQDWSLMYCEGETEPHKICNFIDGERDKHNLLEIYQGIHSCDTYSKATQQSWELPNERANVFLCVIPKGARYLQEDFDGNYVSDKLIIFENNEAYERYKKSSSTVG